MERLTFEVHDGGIFVKESDVKTFTVEDEIMHTGNAVRKLAEYEDLEEQGKLLKLPCTVGDTVYVIPSKTNYCLNIINGYSENNRVYEQVVNRIEISESGYLLVTCDGMASVVDTFYKNTWFLTRKEAESALKELSDQNWCGGEGK